MSRMEFTIEVSIHEPENGLQPMTTEFQIEQIRTLRNILAETVTHLERQRILPMERDVGSQMTVAGQPLAAVADYIFARDLMDSLLSRIPKCSTDEKERLELNADIPQLAFHLAEVLEQIKSDKLDPTHLARSLTFLNRHIVRFRHEFDERRHEQLGELDRELVLGLGRLARRTFVREFAHVYDGLGYRRPFIDKFYRDYSITGVPDGLVAQLHAIAEADAYDMYLCVLKGGLTFALLLELLGLSRSKIHHVVCGRASGSHTNVETIFQPIDFTLDGLAKKSILIIENNVATGMTLKALAAGLPVAQPSRMGLFVDYLLSDVNGITRENLSERLGYPLSVAHVGPYDVTKESEALRALKQQLVRRIESALAA